MKHGDHPLSPFLPALNIFVEGVMLESTILQLWTMKLKSKKDFEEKKQEICWGWAAEWAS